VLVWKLLWEAVASYRRFLVSRSCRNFSSSWRFCEILSGPWHPLRGPCSAWSFTGPCEKILWRSQWNAVRGLNMILHRPLWEHLRRGAGEILYFSLHDLVQVLVDLLEILLKSSSGGPYIKILKMLCTGAWMEVLLGCSEEFFAWRSSKILYKECPSLMVFRSSRLRCPGMRFLYEVLMSRHSVASCAKTNSCCCRDDNVEPDLLLIHSTVACIWYIDFLPPTLFRVSCRCNFFTPKLWSQPMRQTMINW